MAKEVFIFPTQIASSWVGCFLEFNVNIDFSLIFIYCRVSSGKKDNIGSIRKKILYVLMTYYILLAKKRTRVVPQGYFILVGSVGWVLNP